MVIWGSIFFGRCYFQILLIANKSILKLRLIQEINIRLLFIEIKNFTKHLKTQNNKTFFEIINKFNQIYNSSNDKNLIFNRTINMSGIIFENEYFLDVQFILINFLIFKTWTIIFNR